jgi:hypothetical protein
MAINSNLQTSNNKQQQVVQQSTRKKGKSKDKKTTATEIAQETNHIRFIKTSMRNRTATPSQSNTNIPSDKTKTKDIPCRTEPFTLP